MSNKEDKMIKQEFTAFYGYGWKTWDKNTPMVSIDVNDGYGSHVSQFFTIEEALKVISIIQDAIEEAKATEDYKPLDFPIDDTPF